MTEPIKHAMHGHGKTLWNLFAAPDVLLDDGAAVQALVDALLAEQSGDNGILFEPIDEGTTPAHGNG